MDRRAWALLLILGAIWGASYLFIKIALRDLSPGMVSWIRVLLAAAVLMAVASRRGGLRQMRDRLPMLALLGAVQAAGPFTLIAAGEEEISSSLAGILVSSAPLFTAAACDLGRSGGAIDRLAGSGDRARLRRRRAAARG